MCNMSTYIDEIAYMYNSLICIFGKTTLHIYLILFSSKIEGLFGPIDQSLWLFICIYIISNDLIVFSN